MAAADLPVLAQARPGDRIQFQPIAPEEAVQLYIEQQRRLGRWIAAIRRQWGRKMKTIDLNCDFGESFGVYRLGKEEILPYITSVNIACGFHAGDPLVMRQTVQLAIRHGVAIGAHPGFPDLLGFGRRMMAVSPEEVYAYVVYQIGALAAFVKAEGE